ncbi:unnamed protein product, partial [Mesorhabditis spiculigera]
MIEAWQSRELRTIWIKVLKEHTQLIPILIEQNFEIHHAQPSHVMLTKYVATEGTANLPSYPYTQVGVGGIVVDDEGRFLMMREREGPYLGWKIPGGLADPGESPFMAAVREVNEETSVDAEPVCILGFRNTQKIKFDMVSDIYFVVAMRPKSGGNHDPKACPKEASAAAWLTREEIWALKGPTHASGFLRGLITDYEAWKASGHPGIIETKGSNRQGNVSYTYNYAYSKPVDCKTKASAASKTRPTPGDANEKKAPGVDMNKANL